MFLPKMFALGLYSYDCCLLCQDRLSAFIITGKSLPCVPTLYPSDTHSHTSYVYIKPSLVPMASVLYCLVLYMFSPFLLLLPSPPLQPQHVPGPSPAPMCAHTNIVMMKHFQARYWIRSQRAAGSSVSTDRSCVSPCRALLLYMDLSACSNPKLSGTHCAFVFVSKVLYIRQLCL